ncbi:hypothetical protein [Almyronema epifaneia]|uniref:Uncharacterized protein n=1 Tax=Almyronema epifaneia S1 TaxID=2991925 RepID=A0ABW6IIA6_9CYAN
MSSRKRSPQPENHTRGFEHPSGGICRWRARLTLAYGWQGRGEQDGRD